MKFVAVFITSVLLVLSFSKNTFASLLVVNKQGQVSWNVLSFTTDGKPEIPQSLSLEIKQSELNSQDETRLALVKDGENLNLKVLSGSSERNLNVGDVKDKVIEIEERPESQRVAFGILGNTFSIVQRNVSATTQFPININPKSAKVSVTTKSGERYLAIFPYEAYQSALRAKVLSGQTEMMNLNEDIDGVLVYKIPGEKSINFFDIYTLSMPVVANISAQTGEVVSTEAPVWFKIISYILT